MFDITKLPLPSVYISTHSLAHCVNISPCQYEQDPRLSPFKTKGGLTAFGYPLKNIDFNAHALLSARNLSLADKKHANLTTLCNCCFGSVTHIDYLLKEDTSLRNEIYGKIGKVGLKYEGN